MDFVKQSPAGQYAVTKTNQSNNGRDNQWKQKTEQHLVLISPRETTLGSYCADREREKPDNFKQSHELNRPLNVDELDGYQILEKIHA